MAKILAETASIQGAASWLLDNPEQAGPWDLMAVYFDGIDHFGHGKTVSGLRVRRSEPETRSRD